MAKWKFKDYNDAKRLMVEDSKEKKRISRGAMNKNRTGKGTIHLNEYTNKEIQNMSGPCTTISPTTKLTYDGFKALSTSMQIMYIRLLIETYSVSISRISKDLFGLTSCALSTFLTRRGIKRADIIDEKMDRRHRKPGIEWTQFINGGSDEVVVPHDVDVSTIETNVADDKVADVIIEDGEVTDATMDVTSEVAKDMVTIFKFSVAEQDLKAYARVRAQMCLYARTWNIDVCEKISDFNKFIDNLSIVMDYVNIDEAVLSYIHKTFMGEEVDE